MGYLVATFFAALAMSVSIFNVSGSIFMAFLAYSLTGTLLLLAVLLTEALKEEDATQFSTTE